MAVFNYKALNPEGKQISGSIRAKNISDAGKKLRKKSLNIFDLQPGKSVFNPLDFLLSLFSLLNPNRYSFLTISDKMIFFRQLSLMLRSGHTLTQSLRLCVEMTANKRFKKIILNMLSRIESGSSFSVAMEAQKNVFTPTMARLVGAAEISGQLQSMLQRIAENMERNNTIKAQFISNMIYPSLLFVISLAVFIGLTVGLIPKFARILENKSSSLPPLSQAMMDVSEWMITYGGYIGIGIIIGVIILLIFYSTRFGKNAFDLILIKLPIVGSNIRTSGMAQMGWTMSMLLGSGLTVLESIRIISDTIGNRELSKCFDKAGKELLDGHSLAYGLRQPQIPLMVQYMSGVGEHSGELEYVMMELGKHYQYESEQKMRTLMALMEPLMILLVGSMVAFVYIGFFKAMMQVSTG